MKRRTSDLLALLLAILVGFGNVYNVIVDFLRTPSGTQYLGTGRLYPPDYIGYLTFIAQGLRGNWQIFNLLSQEKTTGFWVIDWPYLLIGHLCRLFSLPVYAGYWLSVFFLTTAIVFCAYLFLRLVFEKIGKSYLVFPVLLAYIFAGPFPHIGRNPLRVIDVWSLTWYYRADFFDRISIIPHHLVANLGVLLFLIFSLSFFESLKKAKYDWFSFRSLLYLTVSLLLIMSISPIKLIYLLPSLGIAFIYGIFYFKLVSLRKVLVGSASLMFLVPVLFLFGLYFQKNVAVTFTPVKIAWEKSMMQWPPTAEIFFITSGPLSVLVIPAFLLIIMDIIKTKIHPGIFLGFLISLLSYALFFTKISLLFNNHNSRLLFPDAYLFMAMVIFLALDKLMAGFKKKGRVVWLIAILLVSFSLPSFVVVLKDKLSEPMGFEGAAHLVKYLPDEIVAGMQFLGARDSTNPLVLTTTSSGLNIILPVYAQARIYASWGLGTIDFPQKLKNSSDFFSNTLSDQQKINFLRREKINYLIFTIYDLPPGVDRMEIKYLNELYFISPGLPLELIFSNAKMVIYKVI
ncbi:MAG: hypothetical protein BWY24_00623 [Microgenomates group bacterium ADurb.Bin219]|nr:MAG: hypothetical protein BWY24_00623 [Microgenomates group bacterium ADurb.Bin219]